MSNEITTIRELKLAVKAAKRVFVKPVFFGAETPIQITKIEANYFLGSYQDNMNAADLHDNARIGDSLANVDGDDPYIG